MGASLKESIIYTYTSLKKGSIQGVHEGLESSVSAQLTPLVWSKWPFRAGAWARQEWPRRVAVSTIYKLLLGDGHKPRTQIPLWSLQLGVGMVVSDISTSAFVWSEKTPAGS